ncbi:MAG: FAD-binding oxidoreductase [Synergistaceae bacterium]|nr:FAD-binding oxidoreductase [Synergistaceae bacterium]
MSDKYETYLRDESRFTGRAEEILFPTEAEEVASALRQASESGVPITVQGSRTGITGAASPVEGRILAMERMKAITGLSVDESGTFLVTLEPGVRLVDLTDCLARKSFDISGWERGSLYHYERLRHAPTLFFPPDPTETTATLGGMFACNAQGLCACRYGATADYVHDLDVALTDGQVWKIARGEYRFDLKGITLPDGRRLETKTAFPRRLCPLTPYKGMDLIDLFAGSEGMLGVVTSLTLRLLPAPSVRWAVMFFFAELERAAEFSQSIVSSWAFNKETVEAVELFDRGSLELVEGLKTEITKLRVIPDISPAHQAAVYVQLAEEDAGAVEDVLSNLLEVFADCGGDESDTWAAEGEEEMKKFTLFRHAVPEAANLRIDHIRRSYPQARKTASDFTAPPGRLKEVVALYRQGIEGSGVSGIVFGHAALGRLHVNLFPETARQREEAWTLIDRWADQILEMGGSLSGENGVGKLKRGLLSRHIPPEQLQAALALKKFFDPQDLLNRGNMF